MIKKILIVVIAFAPFFVFNKEIAFADTGANTEKAASTEDKPKPSAIQLSVMDGIIKYINGVKTAKIQLEWEPLPVNESLVKSLLRYPKSEPFSINAEPSRPFPIIIKINQPDDNKSKLCDLINKDDKEILKQSLGLEEDLCQFKKDNNIQTAETNTLIDSKGIRNSEYIAMLMERNLLQTILTSTGVEYSFDVKKQNSFKVPSFESRNISWYLTIHKYDWNKKKNLYYYRYNIKASVMPFTKNIDVFDSNDDKKIYFQTVVRLKDTTKQSSLINDYFFANAYNKGSIDGVENKALVSDSKFTNLKDNLTILDDVLSIVGGPSKLGTVVQGFLGGTENSSIIVGGLLDFSNGGIVPLLGVNREIGKVGDISTGILLGVGLGEKTSIFLGPSFQTSIFTLSAGGTLGTKQQQSDIGLAGLISVDLSRLSGNKQDINTEQLQSSTGSLASFRDQIDTSISTNNLLKYTLSTSANKNNFQLVRICDKSGKKDASSVVIDTESNTQKTTKVVYLPRGIYGYKVPKGTEVKLIDPSTRTKTKIDRSSQLNLLGDDNLENMQWELSPSKDNELLPDKDKIECPTRDPIEKK